MTAQRCEEALKLVEKLIHSFYCEADTKNILNYFTEDIIWIEEKEEMKTSLIEIKQYFNNIQIQQYEIEKEDYKLIFSDKESCMIDAVITFAEKEDEKLQKRISIFLILQKEKLLIKQLHFSTFYLKVSSKKELYSFSKHQGCDDLQQLVAEKNEVIEMIISNINGGLKVSNDDDTYSFCYVNEGLPKMLGYTYDEFMKMSGGTAVGACYPPDIPQALKACAECFEKGMDYSAEYRMKKKDGSLIWVLDSGRKAIDQNGIPKINSIIIDVTPLKQALAELEIERERYRIALENITDVMYEYDVLKDIFTTFKKIKKDGKMKLEKIEIPDFMETLEDKKIIHNNDLPKILDLYSGKIRSVVEIRIRDLGRKEKWRWQQVRCSTIFDKNSIPIKIIGTMKDITEEKEKERKLLDRAQKDGMTQLLNHAVTEKAVQEYLLQKSFREPCALMILDLDNFKSINDTKGHLFGDKVLIGVAEVLKQNVRKIDILGRIGGDEFLILLKNVQEEIVIKRAGRILKCIKRVSKEVKVSCSIGISFTSNRLENYNNLFKEADTALYEAKRNGRNRFELYNAENKS